MDELQELSVPVPLTRLDEKSPSKAGPIGRIDKIVNYIVTKFRQQDGTNLQLDKRPGWHSLPDLIFDPTDVLDLSLLSLPEAMTAGKLAETNFMVGFDAVPYVYSPAAQAWAKYYNETVLTNKVTQSLVRMNTGVSKCPDSASVGGSHCYVWQDNATGFPWLTILDDNGSAIRSAAVFASVAERIKVRSDGDRFWVTSDLGAAIHVKAYDPATGSLIGTVTASFPLDNIGDPWDVVCDGAVADGLFLIRPHIAGGSNQVAIANFQVVTGSVVSVSDNVGAWGGGGTLIGIGWLEPAGDGSLYAARTDPVGGNTEIHAFKTGVNAVAGTEYHTSLFADPIHRAVNVTGYVDPVTHNVHTACSILPNASGAPLAPQFAINTRTVFGYSDGTTPYLGPFTTRSVGLASRVFYVGEIPCVMAYYTSVPTEVAEVNGFVTQGNPTFFVLRADTGSVVGRIFPGQAAGNWIWQNWTGSDSDIAPDAFQLPSGRLTAGGVGVALPVTGEQSVTRVRANDGPFTDIFSASVGVRNILFDAIGGECVECQNETLIPGPLPRSFDGVSFGAAGAELGPEQPLITADPTSGPYVSGDTRSYVIVWERFNRSGNKMQSPSSISVQYSSITTDESARLVIPTLRTTTYDDWICSIYRTLFTGGQEGTTHHKITSDVAPVFNNPAVDTITFIDSVSDESAQLNEILYGGSGAVPASLGGGDGQQVDHECAPAMNGGTVFGDRAFLVGYDGNVWFSLPGAQGNSLTFSFGFKMAIPTQDQPVSIDCIDTRLIMLCSRSLWFNNQSNYLDATGAGDVPTPLQLPISNGCTGAHFAYRDGIIYASSANGFYLLTRDLDSQYIGGAIEDDVSANLPIVEILADDSQRIYCLLNNGQLAVYDIVSLSWYYWTLPQAPDPRSGVKLTTVNGHIGVCCDNGVVYVSTPGSYDDAGEPILSSVGIADISVAGLPGCQMIWQVIIMGITYSAHTIMVDYTPDGLTDEMEVFGPIDPLDFGAGNGDEYRVWVEPAHMETSSFRLDISDSLASPGRGLSIQQLGLSVGIIPGVRRQSVGRTAVPR